MPLIPWDESMSVGVREMDDDHKTLIAMLNQASEVAAAGHNTEALGHIVEQMVDYTKGHLAREERLLAQAGYPDATAHHKEHDQMIAKALSVQASFRWGATAMLTAEVIAFLSDWLVRHIQSSDKAYGEYLNAKGIH